ncbi:hypothetical protein R1sor_027029 [Riccia sorocarpa]|uniref:Uncharacterized protein n=1 Tax=Riccia sorocarpa TaxID=122646 RepID=A0ABD3GGR6_9MARC
MEDSALALIQIARGHSFKPVCGAGNGPSLFELNLWAVDRLGTTDAFQKAIPEATAAEVQSPATQPSAEPQPTITTLSSDDDFGGIQPSANTVPSANQPHPQNTSVPPIPCGNQRNPTQTRGIDHGEPEVLITSVRLRSRPPTRASTTTTIPGR